MIQIQITFQTGQHPAEIATATVDGVTFTERSRSSAIAKLARALVAAGVPDQPWQASRNGTVKLRGRSIHRHAKLTVIERDKAGMAYAQYATVDIRVKGKNGAKTPGSDKEAGDIPKAAGDVTRYREMDVTMNTLRALPCQQK